MVNEDFQFDFTPCTNHHHEMMRNIFFDINKMTASLRSRLLQYKNSLYVK